MAKISKEYESRILLTEEQYLKMVSYFLNKKINRPFIQNTNIYLDDADLNLQKNGMTLRIRIINDAHSELTLKEKNVLGDNEYSDDILQKDIDLILKKGIFPEGVVKNKLISLSRPLSSYQELTRLYNRRLEIRESDHLVVIDKNTYGDVVDYNLEIETDESVVKAQEWLNFYIEKFNIEKGEEKYIGKAHRAINEAIKRRH